MISAIAAIGEKNRVIGNKGKIPWYISEDFQHFKRTTFGHPIIMGRKTFDTFPNPLPGRTHIVITRNKDYTVPEGVLLANTLEEGIEKAKTLDGSDEIFIIGGGQIYQKALELNLIDRLYLTLVKGDFEGDVFFPEHDHFAKEISSKDSEENGTQYRFVILEK